MRIDWLGITVMIRIYSQFGYILTETYWMVFELVENGMEPKIIIVDHYFQPYRIEYNQFESKHWLCSKLKYQKQPVFRKDINNFNKQQSIQFKPK